MSKSLYEQLERSVDDLDQLDIASVMKQVKQMNKLFALHETDTKTLRATLISLELRHRAELDAMRSEIHAELVDREANTARVAERQRFLFERTSAQPGQLSAYDRASASAAYVEAALVALCPHSSTHSAGCDELAAAN